MSIFGKRAAPKYLRLGDVPVPFLYLGEDPVYDGTTPAIVQLPRATATATAHVPTVGGGAVFSPPVATAVCEARVPTVQAGGTAIPDPAAATGTALLPQITAGVSITLPTAVSVGESIAPEIQVVAPGEVLLPRAEAVAEALVPTISVVAVVQPPIATAVSEALAPTVTVTGEVSAPAATADAEALTPTVTAGASIGLPVATSTGAGLVPSISVPAAAALLTAAATAEVLAPTVTVRTFPQRVTTNGNVTAAAGTNGATSATFNYPAGSASGDLLVMMVQASRTVAGAYSVPTPTGGGSWKRIMYRDDSTSNGVHFSFFYCIRGSETSVTVTATSTSSLRPFVVSIQAYQAGTFDPVLPIGDAENSYTLGPAVGGLTSPSVSPSATKSEVLLFSAWAISGNTALTTTWTSPATELADNRTYVSAASISWNHSIAYEQRDTAGGSLTYTATPSASVFQKLSAAIVINPVGTATLAESDDFNRASLGANWITVGGGTLYISGNEISGVGMPSVPMSFAFRDTPVDSDSQFVRARIRWNGRSPAHSAAAVVVRANPSLYPAAGSTGVQFWFVNNLMGILYEDSSAPNGFVPATGTADYVSTSMFPEGAFVEITAHRDTYTATVNGSMVLKGTVSTAVVPTSNRYVGVMIQDDSGVVGGGQPPANLDDWEVYIL